jgi:hypothetical protein
MGEEVVDDEETIHVWVTTVPRVFCDEGSEWRGHGTP